MTVKVTALGKTDEDIKGAFFQDGLCLHARPAPSLALDRFRISGEHEQIFRSCWPLWVTRSFCSNGYTVLLTRTLGKQLPAVWGNPWKERARDKFHLLRCHCSEGRACFQRQVHRHWYLVTTYYVPGMVILLPKEMSLWGRCQIWAAIPGAMAFYLYS